MMNISRRRLLHATMGTAALGLIASPVLAAAPFSPIPNPGFYRFEAGSYEVTVLSDGTVPIPSRELYINIGADDLQRETKERFLGPSPQVSINAFLVNTGQRLVLIDAGTGELMGDAAGKLPANLEASGYKPDQIDHVILTHIHADHSGGLVREGRPQFANATVHVADPEYRFWIEGDGMEAMTDTVQKDRQTALSALTPYINTARVQRFPANAAPLEGFGSIFLPGHTPGHSAITLPLPANRRLVFWGDIVHGDYIQFDEPGVFVEFDVDGKAAAQTRALAFSEAATRGDLVAGAHLPFPGVGHVRRDEEGFDFIRLNYGD